MRIGNWELGIGNKKKSIKRDLRKHTPERYKCINEFFSLTGIIRWPTLPAKTHHHPSTAPYSHKSTNHSLMAYPFRVNQSLSWLTVHQRLWLCRHFKVQVVKRVSSSKNPRASHAPTYRRLSGLPRFTCQEQEAEESRIRTHQEPCRTWMSCEDTWMYAMRSDEDQIRRTGD